ncbi:hypothetical protein CKO25_09165 [Thiocapsa imhoffii]|uniref:Uncharacterized protein n=1 Tax=Thiocapsa imhoffii TaxID=382777 RepID=A0A9X0WHY2_9GAMM|nr:hypothetical protein [Thiocapsa imhoffii]MBK1644815.1 hypothetical protein [Thiocapsa imhoffii]
MTGNAYSVHTDSGHTEPGFAPGGVAPAMPSNPWMTLLVLGSDAMHDSSMMVIATCLQPWSWVTDECADAGSRAQPRSRSDLIVSMERFA